MHEPSEGHRRASLKAGSRSCGLRRHPIFDCPLKCRNAAERRTTPMRTPRPAQCRRASLATIHKPRALITSFDRLFLQPSLRAGRYSKRPPCLNLPHGIVESLLRHLPMRPILIGKPHVHHEGISVIGASYSKANGSSANVSDRPQSRHLNRENSSVPGSLWKAINTSGDEHCGQHGWSPVTKG
jgi:hypothetical protein